MNLINKNRTQGELTNLIPYIVNLLIRLTTIKHFLNTNVCHHQKGGDYWNKMCLTLPLKVLSDNKALKNC